jgi:dolichol-phosphate mannosyltransferase
VTRPLHLFGPIGFGSVTAGVLGGSWILVTKILTGAPVFLAHGPLLLLSAVLVQTGVVLIGLGLLAELLTRIYMDGRHRRIYTVARQELPVRQEWSSPRAVPVPVRTGALQ